MEIYSEKIYSNKNCFFDYISLMLVSYITVSSIYPPLKSLGYNNLLITKIFMILWFIITFYKKPKFYKKPTIQRFFSISFMIYSFLMPYIFGKGIFGNRFLGVNEFFFLYIVYEYNSIDLKLRNNIKIIKITFVFVLITLIKTMQKLIENPAIARNIKSSGEYTINVLKSGVGGYSFIYFLVLMIPILTHIIFFTKVVKKEYKLLLFVIEILFLYVIILSNFFTALMLSVLSIVIMSMCRYLRDKNKRFLIFVLQINIIMFIFLLRKQIGVYFIDVISNFVGNDLTFKRFQFMKLKLINSSSESFNYSRVILIKKSCTTFFENFFMGIISNSTIDQSNFKNFLGGHSYLMDTFTFLGFIPGMSQLYVLCQPYIKMLKNTKYIELIITSFFVLLYILIFNSEASSMGFVTGLILPTYWEILNKGCLLKNIKVN